MARKTSRTPVKKRASKAGGRAKSRPAGLPDEPAAARPQHAAEPGAPPAGDGKRVAVLARSIVSPRVKR
jgi:hypothetical protein